VYGGARDMKLATTKRGDAAEIPGQAYKNRIGRMALYPNK
jgi:hypothetical protein